MSAASSQCLPAEWQPQSAMLLTWPHAQHDWGEQLLAVEDVYIKLATAIAQRQILIVSCFNAKHQQYIKNLLERHKLPMQAIRLYVAASNDTWIRDNGPLTIIKNNKPLLLDFQFNAWGKKYDYTLDNALTRTLQQQKAFSDTPLETINLVLEGGSIEVDGEGTLLTTRRCLLTKTRNTKLTHAQLANQLEVLLGVQRILWLDNGGLMGDDTDGHIDMLARFIDPTAICYTACDDPDDANYPALDNMLKELKQFKTLTGQTYQLIPLPWPQAKYNQAGERLPASYANFVMLNKAILMPSYHDPADELAQQTLQRCFPKRAIIPIPSLVLIEQYGSLHCATMQLPQGVVS